MKQKATIQVLLAKPNSEFINDTELNESETRVGHISPEINKTIAMLQEYLKMARDIEGNNGSVDRVYIGHYNTNLRSSILICDDSFGWLTLNLPPTRAVESPSFELKKTDDRLLNTANDHFDRVWTICRSNNSIIEIV